MQEQYANLLEMENLKREIDNELIQIGETLKKVAHDCEMVPHEDDSILCALNKTSDVLKANWKACNIVYEEMGQLFGKIIRELRETVVNIVDKIDDLNNQ